MHDTSARRKEVTDVDASTDIQIEVKGANTQLE